MEVPQPYELVLLTLGGFRLVRLVGWDTLTEPFRVLLTGYDDEGAATLSDADYDPDGRVIAHSTGRLYVSTLIRCPWCQGFWIALILWGAWLAFPTEVVYVMVPLALSAAFGLIAKNLDP